MLTFWPRQTWDSSAAVKMLIVFMVFLRYGPVLTRDTSALYPYMRFFGECLFRAVVAWGAVTAGKAYVHALRHFGVSE